MKTIATPLPNIKRFSLLNAGILTKVAVPSGTGIVTVKFIDSSGKLAFEGTDGGTIGSIYISITSDTFFEMDWANPGQINRAVREFYLAGDENAVQVEVLVEE